MSTRTRKSRATPPAPISDASQAFFAALLSASMGDCNCKTCRILRKLAKDILDQYEEI